MPIINPSSLTTFDILILAIVLISTIFGFYRGFIGSFLSFAGWLVAMYLGFAAGPLLAPFFSSFTISDSMASVIGSFAIFLIIAIIISLFNSFLNRYLENYPSGIIGKSSGLVLGFFRGCFLAVILFYIIILVIPTLNVQDEDMFREESSDIPEWAKKSETIILLKRGTDLIAWVVPKTFEQELQQSIIDSTDEQGRVELPNTKAEKIRSVNKLLNSLPKDVIDKTSDTDLITLQDTGADPEDKARILEKIADQYHQYNNSKMIDGMSKYEIEQNNQQYHKIMMMLEGEIVKYRMHAREHDKSNSQNSSDG